MEPWLIVVLLGAVVLVYAYLLPKQPPSHAQASMIKEIEDTIGHFADEIEEENKELFKLFSEMKSEYEKESAKLMARIELLEKRSDATVPPAAGSPVQVLTQHQETLQSPPRPLPAQAPAEIPAPPNPEAQEKAPPAAIGMNIRGRYAELFRLYDEGKSIEAIARKLGLHKGEIQLIIQLAKQEERTRAEK